MNEGDFWNNLDSFVEQKAVEKAENEKVGDWLKSVPDPKNEKLEKSASKTKLVSG